MERISRASRLSHAPKTKSDPPFAQVAKGRPPSFYHSAVTSNSGILSRSMPCRSKLMRKGVPPAAHRELAAKKGGRPAKSTCDPDQEVLTFDK